MDRRLRGDRHRSSRNCDDREQARRNPPWRMLGRNAQDRVPWSQQSHGPWLSRGGYHPLWAGIARRRAQFRLLREPSHQASKSSWSPRKPSVAIGAKQIHLDVGGRLGAGRNGQRGTDNGRRYHLVIKRWRGSILDAGKEPPPPHPCTDIEATIPTVREARPDSRRQKYSHSPFCRPSATDAAISPAVAIQPHVRVLARGVA